MPLSAIITAHSVQLGSTAGGLPLERVLLIPDRLDTGASGGLHPDGAILASAFGDALGQLKPGQRYRLTLTPESPAQDP